MMNVIEYTKENMRLLFGDSYEHTKKYDEIIEDFDNLNKPSVVVKGRMTGCTSLLVSYLLTKIIESQSSVWYFCGNVNECNAAIEKFSRIQYNCNQRMFTNPLLVNKSHLTIHPSFGNGSIRFVSVNSAVENKLMGQPTPDIVVYDEMAFFNTTSVNNVLEYINMRRVSDKTKHIKEICVSTLSQNGSVFNFIAEIFKHIKINWTDFPQKFGTGTRLERVVNNIKLTIKIDKDNIADVLENKSFIEVMTKEGWELTSDWRENYKKITLQEYAIRTEIDAETELEYDERVNGETEYEEEEPLNIVFNFDEEKLRNFLENDFIYNEEDISVKEQYNKCSDWCKIR